MTDPRLVEPGDGRLAYRLRPGSAPSVLLLHGLSGDENSMWVLETALPQGVLMAAPRGLHARSEGGYSWVAPGTRGWPSNASFREAAAAVRCVMADLAPPRSPWILVGFSQGAALGFATAQDLPRGEVAVIALAAFLPQGEWEGLQGIPVYWGHGTQDDRVPIERARRDVTRLREAGADVTACEADVGHKLGIECLRGLKAWLADTLPRLSEP